MNIKVFEDSSNKNESLSSPSIVTVTSTSSSLLVIRFVKFISVSFSLNWIFSLVSEASKGASSITVSVVSTAAFSSIEVSEASSVSSAVSSTSSEVVSISTSVSTRSSDVESSEGAIPEELSDTPEESRALSSTSG